MLDLMNPAALLIPVILPIFSAALIFVAPLGKHWRGLIALATLLLSLFAAVLMLVYIQSAELVLVYQAGGWELPFGISLVGDPLSLFMVFMAQIVLCCGVLYSIGSRERVVSYRAYFPLMLTLSSGLCGAFLTGDFFNLFVFAELLVVSGAILTAISDDKMGVEAAYKYFFISLLSSFFLLFAVGGIYISYGSLNMADIANRIAQSPQAALLPAVVGFLLAAFMIKGAAVPFHFWQPDFHTVSPTAVSAMLSSVVVKLGVYGIVRMKMVFAPSGIAFNDLLVVVGITGILLGGLSALRTHNLKRMLAYSTLAQVGFILVAIGWNTPFALAAGMVFAFNHSLLKAGLLMLSGAVASRAPVKSASFEVLTGVGRGMPFAGVLFFIGLMALAGIPPLNGFISKLMFFRSGVEARAWISLIAIVPLSLFTLLYSWRAFVRVWWQPRGDKAELKSYGDRLTAPLILIGLCLVLGIWGEPLIVLAQAAAEFAFDPSGYVIAVLSAVGY